MVGSDRAKCVAELPLVTSEGETELALLRGDVLGEILCSTVANKKKARCQLYINE